MDYYIQLENAPDVSSLNEKSILDSNEGASCTPPGSNIMNCHYVFTVTRTSTGAIEKWKCRLVADGNTQKYLIDFDRIFSTVVQSHLE